ncbi:hypothetical protein RTF48_25155, partial [Escherichia coli]|uniref:hypothetical protein n=1 Tax=Escherichia coli TaxID=562 RepID=UPI0028EB747E
QLQNGHYNLSRSEEEGLYFCSVREEKAIEVEFERWFITIICDSAAPRFLNKLRSLRNSCETSRASGQINF